MPWPCFLIDPQSDERSLKRKPGAVYYGDLVERWEWALSAEFLRDWYGRRDRLLLVRLPSGDEWCADFAQTADEGLPGGGRAGWEVVGTPPRFSVSPSINVVGRYHGWLRDGVLSDDCEGRVLADVDSGKG